MKQLAKLIEIGRQCREWRLYAGLTQREMAKYSGYSHQMISAFEKGTMNNAVLLQSYYDRGFRYGEK